ncbi:hypothetical protein [Alkalimarinus alittae]|uniref:Uncharacterized protein n=1 Tax=Alkalimarinus alittae TaxID=2961619 RepID=A0ABY6N2Z1_9ALTE|nr:hypothetical protein [Alkalimarinus alittae]UZE96488.1 hypothetical protein NKI27_01695 [Alkalimarinus alittae]
MLIRHILTTASMLVILLLPTMVSGDSLADKKADTPVESWGNQEAELERAILTETIEPTAAGGLSDMGHGPQKANTKMHDSKGWHGGKQYKNAYEYKREVFGSN